MEHVCKCSLKVSASGYFGGTKDTVYDGILYASTNYLSFIDPNRRKPQYKIQFGSVNAIRPGMDQSSLQIETSDQKYHFINFLDRDDAMGRFMEMWTNHQQNVADGQSSFLDPLAVATVSVGGQAVKVSGKDVNNALAFGKRHAHKVDLQVKDGNVAIGFNPNKKRPSEQRKSNSGKASEPPRRYVRMAGHSGLQGSRMGLYIEQPELVDDDGYPVYKHQGGWFLYYYKPNKFWFVGSRVGKRSGWLYVQSDEKCPDRVKGSWRYWDDSEKKWLMDRNVYCEHVTQAESSRLSKEASVPQTPGSEEEDKKHKDTRPARRNQPRKGDLQRAPKSIFVGSQLENTWFSALYDLYLLCDPPNMNQLETELAAS
uniref:Uncharacterized protein n=1 Tax=Amorphochlora amoebiformis TaxID=1561963 RepID=A0A7S0CQ00_9EUKA